jgi:glycosyltransferase involved in cell wall biosynthesis
MRIAYVCADPGVPVFGYKGSSIHVQEVLYTLLRFGAKIKLFASRIDGEIPRDLQKIEIHTLPVFNGDREESVLSSNNILRQKLEQAGPFDLVYERYSLWSFSAMEYAKSLNCASLLEVNSPLIEEQIQYRELPDPQLAERVAERVFRAAKVLIAVSNEIAAYLSHYVCTYGKVHVVPNGVNPNRFPNNHKAARRASDETFIVGFVGTLKPWHGLHILVEAFNHLQDKVPNTRLMIVGDGPERSELVKKLKEKGLLPLTEITGTVAPSEVPGMLSSMDVAVAPYPLLAHFYFSPLKVYEYMAAGLPVVASSIGQLAELIQDGENGILVPPGDPVALAGALDKLYRNPLLCKRLGTKARQTVLESHTWDATVEYILNLSGAGTFPKSKVRSSGGDII